MQSAAFAYRGNIIENSHIAHIAVVGSNGAIIKQFNQPSRLTLVRSAAKPAQALVALETGIVAKFGFTKADIALMCASHSSEPAQVSAVLEMLQKLGLTESALICGGHAALSDTVNQQWERTGFRPTAACNTCSGKHVGVLAAALALAFSPADYANPNHPIQEHSRLALAKVLQLDPEQISWATDGCGLPTPAFALDRLADVYRRIALGGSEPERQVFEAMTTNPQMVGGQGRFCTNLMQAFDGELIGKFGADASYAIGIRPGNLAPDGLGISVKVEDGNTKVLYAIVCEVLEQLQIGTPQQRGLLSGWHRPQIFNTLGNQVGNYQFGFSL